MTAAITAAAPLPVTLPALSSRSGSAKASGTFSNTVSVPDKMTFDYVGDLGTARYGHTATLLNDGRVLVTGGRDLDQHVLGSTELFSPVTREWSPTGNFNAGREGHTATLLQDGRVLVIGGKWGGGDLAKVDVFDPTTDTWLGGGDLLFYARSFHTATLLSDGSVLVTGGYGVADGGYPANTEVIDLTYGRRLWPVLYEGRAVHTTTLLPDGNPLVVGGRRDSRFLGSYELYIPSGNRWVFGQSAGVSGGEYHTSTLLPDGRVLVVGGKYGANTWEAYSSGAQLYDYRTGAWATTTPMSIGRNGHTATLLPNGKVMVAGGDSVGGYQSSVELYNASAGVWRSVGNLNTARTLHTATLLPDGKVLVVGGRTDSAIGSVEVGTFLPTNTFTATMTVPSGWMTSPTMPVQLEEMAAGAAVSSASLSNDGNSWGGPIAIASRQTVTTTWYFGADGLEKPIYLRLRDVNGQAATVVTGTVNLDTGAPSSSMTPLPPLSSSSITLNWSGTDSLSGIASYDVQVREGDTGQWTDILSATSGGSIGFSGVSGRTYYFRVRARDVAGNVEPWTVTYDAWTTVMRNVHLPLVIKDPSPTPTRTPTPSPTPQPSGIHGRITYKGSAASLISLKLWFWNGTAWSVRAETNTAADGTYLFGGMASLGSGQQYLVGYGVNTSDARYLRECWGRPITAYTSGHACLAGTSTSPT